VIQRLSTPQNLTALAYESIKRHILEGNLSHDVRLTEETLSQQLGISKSPIREALNNLQGEGLIRIEPRRGAYLRSFCIKEVEDLYNLREALEVYAVSVAKITPQLIQELKSSVERTKKYLKSHDKIHHIEEDTRFHTIIARRRTIRSSVGSLRTSRTSYGFFVVRRTISLQALRPEHMPRSCTHLNRKIVKARRLQCDSMSAMCAPA